MSDNPHHIEERSVVWLRLAEDGWEWEIDSPSDDGYPLEGYDSGPVNSECDCDDPKGCEVMTRHARRNVPIPTLRELYLLLKNYYGEV